MEQKGKEHVLTAFVFVASCHFLDLDVSMSREES